MSESTKSIAALAKEYERAAKALDKAKSVVEDKTRASNDALVALQRALEGGK